MSIIGIDPGKSGGVAVIHNGDITAMPLSKLTDQDVWRFLAEREPSTVILEKVHSSPQMGVKSAFTFGESYGSLRMAVIAAGLRLVMVSPAKWQREIGLQSTKAKLGASENKRRNRAKAQELFPSVKVTHAIADALLLAEWGKRNEG